MESKVVYVKQNPQETANPISKLFFWWTYEIFKKGARKDLVLSDLYSPLKVDESERLGNHLEKYWEYELKKLKDLEYTVDKDGQKKPGENNKMPRLHKAIVRAFWPQYLFLGFVALIQATVLRLLQPIFQGWIISYFNVDSSDKAITKTEVLLYAGCMLLSTLGVVFILHHGILMAQQIGMRVRVACSSLLYRKILRLSKGALTQTAAGQVINLLSNDMSRFDETPVYLNYIWIMPIQVTAVGYIMWQKIGAATIVGIGTLMFITLPVHSIFTGLSQRLRAMIATLTDRRVQLMSELIAGIQVVKMYAWEVPFAKIVSATRLAEIKKVTLSSYVRAMFLAIIMFTERTVLFFTLVSFVLMGNTLTADVTYVLAAYFNILQLSAALFFPQALIMLGESMVSVRRVEEFLLLDEVSDAGTPRDSIIHNGITKSKGKRKMEDKFVEAKKDGLNKIGDNLPVSIQFERVSANWILSQLPPTLCNVSIDIQGGQLCALIGSVGSGKSSILHVILKELPLGAGSLRLFQKELDNDMRSKRGYYTDNPNLKISYASQEPWLFSGTVRENILFGQVYDKDRYLAVTKACALTKDFHQLPHSDMTVVGESGSSLSGGQKARINLARAVYRQADIYLLDDPLSAVDARVAKHLFNRCITEYLHGKTRILVTHQLQFIKRADNIVALDRGCVKLQGSYEELSQSNPEFVKMIDCVNMAEANKKTDKDESEGGVSRSSFAERKLSTRSSIRRASIMSTTSSCGAYWDEGSWSSGDSRDDEAVETGALSTKVYTEYFRQGGSYCILFLLVVIFVMSQVSTSGNDYWVSYWTNLESVRTSMHNNSGGVSEQYNFMFNDTLLSGIFTLDDHGLLTTNSAIYVYTFCIIMSTLLVILRSFFFMKICMNASRNIHNEMFANILHATMKFFCHNPSGRILNRFSKDVGAMDEILPRTMLEALQVFLLMCAILIMVVVVNVWMIIPIAILGVVFYFARIYYLKTAQDIKRLEGIAKSPVFSHVNATLNGLTTIRSSKAEVEHLLRKEFDHLQDVHTGAWYLTLSTATAFGLVLDLIASTFLACVCFSFILLDSGNTLGGNVGLAISQSLIMIGTLQYGVRRSAEVISQMTSVERILQYTNLPKEGPLTSNNPPPPTWPSQARITFNDVSMSYDRDEPPVLKNLKITIEPGWKVGVVGRTGAGKSSLITALFRLFADDIEGEIKIDERDTKTLGLHELRSCISIIPQEPVLFSETLRYNLDPFNSYDDATLWDVLREVELSDIALDQVVQQSGNNFSVGQRQLICLARAILRNNKILVLDEATANIDSYTDSLIQQTIRTKFADCTVLTIAHRLNTIIDSDRIIVMDAGRIVEFGCPHELLRDKPNGHFAQMVDKTGASMAQSLRREAEKACVKNSAQRSLDLSRETSTETDDAPTIIEEYTL